VHRSDKVAAMLSAAQDQLNITAKSIPKHCPTRFAIRLNIMEVCAVKTLRSATRRDCAHPTAHTFSDRSLHLNMSRL
jgi:hypothetical protein